MKSDAIDVSNGYIIPAGENRKVREYKFISTDGQTQYPIQRFARVIIWRLDKILMVYNLKFKDWNFPGGKIDPYEPSETGITRETDEEINLKIKPRRLKKIFEKPVMFGDGKWHYGHYFEVQDYLPMLKTFNLNEPEKIADALFFGIDEMRYHPALPHDLSPAVKAYLEQVRIIPMARGRNVYIY